MEVEIDSEAVGATVEMCGAIIRNMAVAKYSGKDQNPEFILFIKNTLINLMGSSILQYTDNEQEGALQKNINQIIEELIEFFAKVKEIQKGAY